MSLSEIVKNYENNKKAKQKLTQSLRSQIEHNIEDVTIATLKLQNHKINQIHKNQQTIENKLRKQQELLTQFRNNQEVWINLYEQLNRALMKAGDLAHYAGYVEAELKQLLGEGTVAQFLQQAEKEDLNEEPHQTKTITEEKRQENQVLVKNQSEEQKRQPDIKKEEKITQN